MRRQLVYVPVLALSLLLFILAANAGTDSSAFLLAFLGAMVPASAAVAVVGWAMLRWRQMAASLNLIAAGGGPYPDMIGRYEGRRLTISRRTDRLGIGPRQTTVVRLEGHAEIRLPGTVTSAAIVRSVLRPLLEASR